MQRDIGILLGWKAGAEVSRYEKKRQMPTLEAALACEIVLGVPVAELFGGMRDEIAKKVRRRLPELRSRLQCEAAAAEVKGEAHLVAQRLRWIDARIRRDALAVN